VSFWVTFDTLLSPIKLSNYFTQLTQSNCTAKLRNYTTSSTANNCAMASVN